MKKARKYSLNIKGAYICSEIQITEQHKFPIGAQNLLYSAWN